MLVPLESKQAEAVEKNETERIEYFSQSQNQAARPSIKKLADTTEKLFLTVNNPSPSEKIVSISFLVRKIYLFHSRLLI